jgi:hypothetical protein
VVSAEGGSSLAYQWNKNGSPLPDATNPVFTIPQAQIADAGRYTVTVRNNVGAVTSAEALLEVIPLPVIVHQPRSLTVACGEPFTLSVLATNTLTTVTQVFDRASPASAPDWFSFPVSGNGTLTISYDFYTLPDELRVLALNETDEPSILASIATNGTGVLSVNFQAAPGAQLAITVAPFIGPMSLWKYRAELVTFPLTYQWLKDGWSLESGSDAVYSVNAADLSHQGNYSVLVADANGSVSSTAVSVLITGPRLRIQPVVAAGLPSVQLLWTAQGYYLQRCDLLNGPWTDVPDAFSGMLVPANAQGFYRLHQGD